MSTSKTRKRKRGSTKSAAAKVSDRVTAAAKVSDRVTAAATSSAPPPQPKPASRKGRNATQRDAGAENVESVAKRPRVGAPVSAPAPTPPSLVLLESLAAPKNAQVAPSAERDAQTKDASLVSATPLPPPPPPPASSNAKPMTARQRKNVAATERRAERQRAREAATAEKRAKKKKEEEEEEVKRAATGAGGRGDGGGATSKTRKTAAAAAATASSRSRKVTDDASADGDDGGGDDEEVGAEAADTGETKRKASGGGRAKSGAAATATTRPKREPMRVSNRHELVRLLVDAIRQPGVAVVADTDAGSVRLDGEEDADTCVGDDAEDEDEEKGEDEDGDPDVERKRDGRSAAEILQDRLDRYYELRLLDIAAAARTRPRPAGKSVGAPVTLADVLGVATEDDDGGGSGGGGGATDENKTRGAAACATRNRIAARSREEEKRGGGVVRRGGDGESQEKESVAATVEDDDDDLHAAAKLVALRKKRARTPSGGVARPKKTAKTTAIAAAAAASSTAPVVSAHLERDLANVAEWCIQVESLVYRTSETRSEHVCRMQSIVLAVTLQGRVPRSSMRAALFEHDYYAPLIPAAAVGADGRNSEDGGDAAPGPRWKPVRGARLTRAETARAFRECTFEELCEWLDIDRPDDMLCPGCGLMCGRVESIKQTRGLDEGHTVLHKCTACDHRWK